MLSFKRFPQLAESFENWEITQKYSFVLEWHIQSRDVFKPIASEEIHFKVDITYDVVHVVVAYQSSTYIHCCLLAKIFGRLVRLCTIIAFDTELVEQNESINEFLFPYVALKI